MNYETYKKLTEEQKEEYNFSIRPKLPEIYHSFKSITFFTIILFLISLSIAMMVYMTIESFPIAEDIEVEEVIEVSRAVFKILEYWLYILKIYLIYYTLTLTYYLYLKQKFYKKHNIKKVKGKLLWWK